MSLATTEQPTAQPAGRPEQHRTEDYVADLVGLCVSEDADEQHVRERRHLVNAHFRQAY